MLKSFTPRTFAGALTALSLVLLCWVMHRAGRPRARCLNSRVLRAVQLDQVNIPNCLFESRLKLGAPALSWADERALRTLERAAAHAFVTHPRLRVTLVKGETFSLERGRLTLGRTWLKDPARLGRALALSSVDAENVTRSHFNSVLLTNFIALTTGELSWPHLSFATVPITRARYCSSPYRAVSHDEMCRVDRGAEVGPWGLGALLAKGLHEMFTLAPLKTKDRVLRQLRMHPRLPTPSAPPARKAAALATWYARELARYAVALGLEDDLLVRRALARLDVDEVVPWELTVDLTHTPAWREIAAQLTARSRFRPRERALLFTPEGSIALPARANVDWRGEDVRSQKHVVLGCPKLATEAGVPVRAREVLGQIACAKLDRVFW